MEEDEQLEPERDLGSISSDFVHTIRRAHVEVSFSLFIADRLKIRAVAASILGADSCAAKEGVCGRKEHAVDRVQTPEVESARGAGKRRGSPTSKGRNYRIIEERVMLLLQQVFVVRSRVVS